MSPGWMLPTTEVRSVLIVDKDEAFLASLGTSFRQLGLEVWIESTLPAAMGVVRAALPDLIVLDLPVADRAVLEVIPELRRANPRCLIVVVTLSPSIPTATEATRLGVNAYLTKPVSASLILSALGESDQIDVSAAGDLTWQSLDRTIWEYLNQVFVASGSMSEAARRLRVDRRSLRRMLAKAPPIR
jgi:two-component system response regulator RegA